LLDARWMEEGRLFLIEKEERKLRGGGIAVSAVDFMGGGIQQQDLSEGIGGP